MTRQLVSGEPGAELRYTIGQAHDADGNRSEISEKEAVAFLSGFWPPCFDAMEEMIKAVD